MTGQQLIRRTEQALTALKTFAEKSNNTQLLSHIRQLEESTGGLASDGDVCGSTAVVIGHDINIIVNQALTPDLRRTWETLQAEWGQAFPEVKTLTERREGGHIFLSYSRHDVDKALRIRRALESAGHVVWQDLTAIKGGDEWIRSIEEGVERSYALVTVVSEASQKSEWVQIEYLHAKRRNKLIVPIKIDDSEIPTMMLATNVVPGHPDLDAGIKRLLAALPEDMKIEPSVGRRALEIRYLDKLLLEHSVWQEVYTPMSGVGQLRVEAQLKAAGIQMKFVPSPIDVKYLVRGLGEADNDGGCETEERHYEADIIPAVADMRQLIILGDPGAGKTTTLWKILSDHATAAKSDPAAGLPVFVRLGTLGGYDDLETAIKAQLGALGQHYEMMLTEKRLVFLLDGLNELPAANREANLEAVKTLVVHCRKDDLITIVTCRELDYKGPFDLGVAERVVIKPLDPGRIRRFVNAYIEDPPGKGDELFWQLTGEEQIKDVWQVWQKAGASFELFWEAQDIPRENPDVYGSSSAQDDQIWRDYVRDRSRSMLTLASNPYMLYMMTQVFTQTGVLPRNRGLLFQNFIDYLLEERERLSKPDASGLKLRLADLAYAMQAEGEGTTFSGSRVMEYLKESQRLYHARSASILSGEGEVRFTHQLLQEYFAAYRLQLVMEEHPAGELFPPENWWEPHGWKETIILLAGLFNTDCTPVIEWLEDAQPEVAARCVAESGAHTPDEALLSLRTLWKPRLIDLKRDPQPQARAAVGRALGQLRLGDEPLDNRPGVGVKDGLPEIAWCDIPGVEGFHLLTDKGDKGTYDIAPFRMAKYPVTYVQFQAFLDDPEGWPNPRWWEGLAADSDHKQQPGDQRFKYDNHPRERVSWYDAVAFCRWLSDKLGYEVRLPTEWEWQWAAQGPDGREYPYEGEFDPTKGNTYETGIGRTSAVGIFPQGASPYDVLDMSGNVWEWCLNEYEKLDNIGLVSDARRVVRGGSWNGDHDFARCAFRYGSFPAIRSYFDFGFRVVVRPPSS